MKSTIVRLHDSDPNPNGRRYTQEDREAAYLLWKTTAQRSQRKTAELLDIAGSTIGTWSQKDGWVERAEREAAEAAESVRTSMGAMLLPEIMKSVETIIEIRDDKTAPPRDRLAAAMQMLGLAGIAPVTKAQTSLIIEPPGRRDDAPMDITGKTVEEIMALEAKYRTA
jgi:hypothetical protein